MKKRIVITGGPGSGKTSIINELANNYICFEEVSRSIILEMKINTSFKPISFEEAVFNERKKDFQKANQTLQFYDRGMIDSLAYFNKNKLTIPKEILNYCQENRYFETVFILPPWENIYTTDDQRFETFEEATEIYNLISSAYKHFGYTLLKVPLLTIKERIDFIINKI